MSFLFDRRRFLQSSSLLAASPYLNLATAADAPRSLFDDDSTAEEVTAGIDLTGMTAVVTGCNSGIGYETMRVLALRGAHVIGTARSMEKGRVACDSVEGRTTPVVLELSEFGSVVACANDIQGVASSIDILICNAGVYLSDLQQVNGLEMHFVVNHLGHFILVNRLMERVTAAAQGRVVIVGSDAHHSASEGIEFDNLSGERDFNASRAYGHSKLANGLFSLELARRLEGTGATSNALHPGVVSTNIVRNRPGWQQNAFRLLGRFFVKSLEEGAATTCYVATSPTLVDVSGYYFDNCNPATPSDHMLDASMAARLWDVSEELTREFLV